MDERCAAAIAKRPANDPRRKQSLQAEEAGELHLEAWQFARRRLSAAVGANQATSDDSDPRPLSNELEHFLERPWEYFSVAVQQECERGGGGTQALVSSDGKAKV
jgi:hypothetical protein